MMVKKKNTNLSLLFCLLVILVSCAQPGNNDVPDLANLTILTYNNTSEEGTIGKDNIKYSIGFYKGKKKVAHREFVGGKGVQRWGKIPDGLVFELYGNGRVKNIITYKSEIRNGIAMSFYENGALRSKGYYVKGNPSGELIRYFTSGAIESESYIENGYQVYYKAFNEDGSPKLETNGVE